MRRCATSERTMTPAKTSTGLVQVIPRLAGKHNHRARVVSATLTSCDGASATPCRWRVQKCKLDNKSQLKGRMTATPHGLGDLPSINGTVERGARGFEVVARSATVIRGEVSGLFDMVGGPRWFETSFRVNLLSCLIVCSYRGNARAT